jgi:PBSX family phage portal protein
MSAAEELTEVSEEVEIGRTELVEIRKKLLEGDRQTDIQRSNMLDMSDLMSKAFNRSGAIEPPLDPLQLVRLVSMSGTLRPLIDTMAVCIHGFGYTFKPVIDLDSSDAFDRVKAAMLIEREFDAERDDEDVEEPPDEEVKKRIDSLRDQARRERAKLDAFFANVSREYSFTRMSRKHQIDKESTGYGAFEVRRNGNGRAVRMNYGPSWTFRALPLGAPVEVDAQVKITDISYRTIKEPVRFRRFVQIYEDQTSYFKEFGDPRVMSRKTGRYFDDDKEMRAEEGEDVVEATELLWMSLDSSESDVYGLIRWSGTIPGVIGSREQSEVNLLFFRSKAIPPMVVLVSGGKLAKGAAQKLERLIEHKVKGVENFHKVVVLQAEPAGKGIGGAGGLATQDKVKVSLQPLTEHIFKDALWQGYKNDNRHEQGQSFRLPPMLRGDTSNLNRATAKITREMSEQLVFGPERRDFEFDVNRTLLADMGIMLWRFALNGPESSDAEQVVEFVTKLLEGVMSVNEARRRISDVVGIELPPFDADWARMPLKQSIAGFNADSLPEDSNDTDMGDGRSEDPPDSDDSDDDSDDADAEEQNTLKLVLKQDEFESLFISDEA